MKLALRFAIATAVVVFASIGSAFAQCYTPSDIGSRYYQVQSLSAYQDGDKYTLQVNVVNLMCTESYGSYRWQPRNALEPITRRTMDGRLYTVTPLSGETLLTTEAYTPIRTEVIANAEFQTFVFKFSAKAVFGSSRTVRLRFFQRYETEIFYEGQIVRPTPTTGVETYIDIHR